MKKIIALFVMAIFLVSILPLSALADEESSGVEVEGEVVTEDFSELDSRVAKKKKERFLEARAEFAEKKKHYLEQREEIKAKIADVKAFCGENPDNERCSGMKKEFMEKDAKDYLLNALEAIEKVLEKRKAKIEELMAETEFSAEVIAGLKARISKLNVRQNRVVELRSEVKAATTKEEIKRLAGLIRDEWKAIRGELDVSSGQILANRFAFVIHRSEALEKKLENTLIRLKARGYDVNLVEDSLASFRAHIAKAKEYASQAKAEFANDGDIKRGHELLVQSHRELKLAHEELRKILVGLKVSAGTDAEAEIETLSEPVEIDSNTAATLEVNADVNLNPA